MLNDENFYVSNWVPQSELLMHPAVVGGMTHAGFGGTLEFIAAGVPCLTFPHFGDQGTNAELLRDAGASIELIPSDMGHRPPFKSNFSHVTPCFTAEDFTRKANEIVVGNSSYKAKMMQLRIANAASGGTKTACDVIETTWLRH